MFAKVFRHEKIPVWYIDHAHTNIYRYTEFKKITVGRGGDVREQ